MDYQYYHKLEEEWIWLVRFGLFETMSIVSRRSDTTFIDKGQYVEVNWTHGHHRYYDNVLR